ncbi:MAG TPA: glycosyltransferase family 2 protein, partial [Anaerolineae bacterium]|nr:glycosyltransferase family 2 protein [Anaerolineae bacterium]
MIRKFLTLASWVVAGVLLIFTARRWLFVLAALTTANYRLRSVPSGSPSHSALPSVAEQTADASLFNPNRQVELPAVLLLAPIRNEAETLPEFLPALARLAYPAEKLTIVLIDDGSTDGSDKLIREWIRGRDNWHLLSLRQNAGKAQALNSALVAFPQGEIVAIYDADERPEHVALQILVSPFADKKIGGVSGRRAVSNPLASPAASYITFEGLVHQLVTTRAKSKLNLAPALLGANCAYRRLALAGVGNFEP